MSKIIFFLFILSACSTFNDLSISTGHRVVKRTYYEVQGAGDTLRKTGAATLAIWARPRGAIENNQDLFNFSTGDNTPDFTSRAGMRLVRGGAFESIARANDKEELSEVTTNANLVQDNVWVHVALTIDYTNKKMQFFVNGKPVILAHEKYLFTQPMTSDTPSNRVAIGAEDNGAAAYFLGDLSGAHVEPRIMSENEIRDLMKKSRP